MKARNLVTLLAGLQLLFSLPLAAQAIYRPLPGSVEFAAPVAPQEVCTPSATTICLSDNRFAVSATWRTSTQNGSGQGVRLTSDTGYFTFFNASNVEVVVKVLNACTFNSRFWVFAGGLTDVNVVLTVRDTVSGTVKTYTNPTGTPFQPIQDTNAFATCNAGTGGTFVDGSSTIVASQTVSSSGGSITVAGSGTALDGAKITFPTGALTASASVTVRLNRGTVTPIASTTFSGAAIDVNVSGASTTFNQPVSITLRNTGAANTVPVPYYVESGGRLQAAQLVAIDRAAGTFTFQTFHASLFTWLFGSTATPIDPVTTAFRPGTDGFQIVNQRTPYNFNGECYGMAAFSLWYFKNQRSLGGLYSRFMNVVGTNANNQPITGQNAIATRAYTSIAQTWTSYNPQLSGQQRLSQQERFAAIRTSMQVTAAPVLLYLYHASGPEAHSVLAYAIDATGRISIYDPNFPNAERTIQYSTASNSFAQYCSGTFCFDGVVYNGEALLPPEPFSNILADAQNNFSNSGGATISITSHTSGQSVTTRFVTLAGVVRSGELLVAKLTVLVNSTIYSADIPVNGSFSIPIALADGVNVLRFETQGKDFQGNLQTTSNNYGNKDFTLRAVVPSSVILMTLTWDKDDTDLDTYVIDPNGDYSAYYHTTTADGGELDRDVIDGYGPEHWTLTNTDVVRYNRPYKFRVHYFSDHGNGPTNYRVTIELYNGTTRQVQYTYSGALSAHSTLNDGPTDTGPDWVDIATIVPTQSSLNGPIVQSAPDGSMIITVPIPPEEERRKLKP